MKFPGRLCKKRVQSRVNARQRDDRQLVREIRRMQTRRIVTGNRAMVRVNDGFKQAHEIYFELSQRQLPDESLQIFVESESVGSPLKLGEKSFQTCALNFSNSA